MLHDLLERCYLRPKIFPTPTVAVCVKAVETPVSVAWIFKNGGIFCTEGFGMIRLPRTSDKIHGRGAVCARCIVSCTKDGNASISKPRYEITGRQLRLADRSRRLSFLCRSMFTPQCDNLLDSDGRKHIFIDSAPERCIQLHNHAVFELPPSAGVAKYRLRGLTRRADDGVDDGQSDKKIVIVFESDFDFGQERDSRSHMGWWLPCPQR